MDTKSKIMNWPVWSFFHRGSLEWWKSTTMMEYSLQDEKLKFLTAEAWALDMGYICHVKTSSEQPDWFFYRTCRTNYSILLSPRLRNSSKHRIITTLLIPCYDGCRAVVLIMSFSCWSLTVLIVLIVLIQSPKYHNKARYLSQVPSAQHGVNRPTGQYSFVNISIIVSRLLFPAAADYLRPCGPIHRQCCKPWSERTPSRVRNTDFCVFWG